MNEYEMFPNDICNIEVTNTRPKREDLDMYAEQLQKHTVEPNQICIVHLKKGGFSLFRKATYREKDLVTDQRYARLGRITEMLDGKQTFNPLNSGL